MTHGTDNLEFRTTVRHTPSIFLQLNSRSTRNILKILIIIIVPQLYNPEFRRQILRILPSLSWWLSTRSPRSFRTKLPYDLFANILDDLATDKQTLCSCALVCRAWYSLAYTRLFKTAVLSGNSAHNILYAEKLLSGSTHHSAFIRTLNIAVLDPKNAPPFLCLTGFIQLIRCLPRLRSLVIIGHLIRDANMDPPNLPPLSLDNLQLALVEVESSSLAMLFAQFTCITELNIHISLVKLDDTDSISSVELDDTDYISSVELDDTDFRLLQGIQIKTLSVIADRSTMASLFRVFKSILAPSLTSLRLFATGDNLTVDLIPMIDCLAPQLQSLTLGVLVGASNPRSPSVHLELLLILIIAKLEQAWKGVDFSHYPTLRSLSLVSNDLFMETVLYRIDKLANLLSPRIPTTLQSLSLDIGNYAPLWPRENGNDWSGIDNLIDRAPGLTNVSLKLQRNVGITTEWVNGILEQVPRLRQQGIFRVKIGHHS